MKRTSLRLARRAGLTCMLALAASDALVAAGEPLPRRWKEMSFADIDVTPFRWGTGDHATCEVPPERLGLLPPGFASCGYGVFRPAIVDGRDGSDRSLDVFVSWREQEIVDGPGPCGPREEVTGWGLIVRSRTRLASASLKLVCLAGIPGITEGDCARSNAAYVARLAPDRAIWFRILSDIVARIEPYAIACDPDASVVASTPPSGGESGAGGAPIDLPRHEVPVTPDWVPALLGQDPYEMRQPGGAGGNTAPETATSPTTPPPAGAGGSAAPRAMRRTAGGLPPEVVAAPLRFFAGGYDLVPLDRREYAFRFDQRVEYVHFEVPLVYPERRERLAFAVEVTTFRDGERFNSFVFDGFALEPGWSSSFPSVSLGRKGGDGWTPGRYRVEMTVDGAYLSSGEFEVVPAGR